MALLTSQVPWGLQKDDCMCLYKSLDVYVHWAGHTDKHACLDSRVDSEIGHEFALEINPNKVMLIKFTYTNGDQIDVGSTYNKTSLFWRYTPKDELII